MSRSIPFLAFAAAALLAAWAGGFAWFLYRANLPTELPRQADGIVALTGGSGRVATALQLLTEGRARVALLSGIGGGAELPALAAGAGLSPDALVGRVTLGRHAGSTRGNAAEAAAWARENDVRSLIVVTAAYHMPRALTEMAQAMPGVTLFPMTVWPPAMQAPGGLRSAATVRLLAAEYTKWLAATLGLSAFGSHHDAALDRATGAGAAA